MNIPTLIVTSILLHACVSPEKIAFLSGNISIGGLFEIYENQNGKCSDIQIDSVQHVEAVKWVIRNLNNLNYIPGTYIGLQAFSTCRDVINANNITFQLITDMRNELYRKCDNRSVPVVGIIGPEFSSEAETTSQILTSLPFNERLLQIGFSTTASTLSNTNIYRNFYRVVPADDIQVQVMILLMKRLEWNYIAIIYEDDSYGIGIWKRLQEKTSEENICIADAFPIEVNNGVHYTELQTIVGSIIRKVITGVVFIGTRSTANLLLDAAHNSVVKEKPTFILSEGTELKLSLFMNRNKQIYDTGKGSFVVNPSKRYIEEFASYWKSLFTNTTALLNEGKTNPWLLDVFESYTGCELNNNMQSPGCKAMTMTQIDEKFEDTLYTSYVIETAFIFSKLLKEIHTDVCNGQSGPCLNYMAILSEKKDIMISKLNNVTINFKDDFPLKLKTYSRLPKSMNFLNHSYNSETALPVYEVYHYRACLSQPNNFCLEKIGNWTDDGLTVKVDKIKDYHQNSEGRSWPNIKKAQCSEGLICSACLPNNLPDEIYFDDGDVLVVGIVPVYDKSTTDPLGCSGIRKSASVEIAEGILYAVKTVNEKTEIYSSYFTNKKVGVIIINSCNQPLTIQNKILRLHQDGIRLPNGTYLQVSHKIMAYVGAYGSSISIASSAILSRLRYVQVSYASTTISLSDRSIYPYFLRVCTPDDKQAKTMVKLIKKLNSNYIQIVYSAGAYGDGGRAALENVTKANRICIANEIKVEEGKYNSILDTLRINSYAKIVIVFLRSHIVKDFAKVINGLMDYGEFMFIGSEAWGKNSEVISGHNKFAGSLTVALEMTQRKTFENYLSKQNPFSYNSNPWLQHYIEEKYGCYIPASFDKSFPKQCDTSLRITRSVSGDDYQQEHWTPFAINAMFAVLMGSNSAFNELCGSKSKTLCDEFRRKPDILWKKISEQKLDILGTGQSIPVFDENGDGNVGYRIYNVQNDPLNTETLKYIEVGKSPLDETKFIFDKSKLTTPDNLYLPSNCPNERVCNECFAEKETIFSHNSPVSQRADVTMIIVLGVVAGCFFFVIIALLVAVVCLCRGPHGRDAKDDDTYLNPTQEEIQQRDVYDRIRLSGMPAVNNDSVIDETDCVNTNCTN